MEENYSILMKLVQKVDIPLTTIIINQKFKEHNQLHSHQVDIMLIGQKKVDK